ncbi:MAG: non-heme iron oxygenase ferredoxin subunit, partial [Neomegalonema sp.]
MSEWIDACAPDDVDEEDLIRWDHGGHAYAIYNTEKGFFATDLMCTHEEQSLEEGLVIGCVIECPLHGGRFDICTGKALSAPVNTDLKTYPVKV